MLVSKLCLWNMLDYHPWTLDSSLHASSAQTVSMQNNPFVKGSASLLFNSWISCNYCQQKVMMSANLGNTILCVVFTVILANSSSGAVRETDTRKGRPHSVHAWASGMYLSFTETEALYLVLNVMDHFRERRHLLSRTLLFIFTRKCSQHPLGFSMYLLPPFRRKDEKQTLLAQNKWPLMSNKISWEAGGERTVFKWDVFFWKGRAKKFALELLMICLF